jgi:hypothetical protein
MTDTFPWFAARLLFEACMTDSSADKSLFEERIVLVHAPAGMESARSKAHELGEAAGDTYENEDGEKVSWSFKEVLDLVQIDESSIGEGSEVYHHYLNALDVDRVRQSLKSGSL